MTLRIFETIINNSTGTTAKIYRDTEWNEYRVKYSIDGVHAKNSDYHTDDKGDAQRTARKIWTTNPVLKF